MSKYRKKPVVVEAIAFEELVAWALDQPETKCVGLVPWSFSYAGHPITHENDDCYLIPTLEGTMRLERGDMLITGVAGEIYPCKHDIFEATYEKVGAGMNVIATGTPERPLVIVEDNDGHTYLIPADEEKRFDQWVAYTESEGEEEWEGHEYDPLGSDMSCYQIIGEVRS